MKAITFQKRLENRYTGSKNSKAYQIVKDLISGTNKSYMVYGNVIRPCAASDHLISYAPPAIWL